MNYTLIKYIEDSRYIDRCGDWAGEEGSFDMEFSRDKHEFAAMWARAIFNGANSDHDVQILINGVPDQYYDEDHQLAYDEIDNLKSDEYHRLQAAKNERDAKLAAEKEQIRAKALEKAALQKRVADLAQYEALKATLGL